MDYTKARIKIHNALELEMDLQGLSRTQQLYKVSLFCKINHNLHLRKIGGQAMWMIRVGKRWIGHTMIELM